MSQFFSGITTIWARLRSWEPASLATVIIASGATFIFLRLASELLEGETFALDRSILLSLRRAGDLSVPIGPAWLEHALTDITSLGGTTVLSLITLISVIYLLMIGRRSIALLLLIAVIGGWALSNGLKIGIGRPRPDIVPHLVEVGDLSFQAVTPWFPPRPISPLAHFFPNCRRFVLPKSSFWR